MDEMLDEDLHITLPEADVTAFFQAELKRCVTRLSARRRVERMDGSLTAAKVRRNELTARLLRGMVDHGIRETVPEVVGADLDDATRAEAAALQRELFRRVTSQDYAEEIADRAADCGLSAAPSDALKLELRWAALEANAAAHAALEEVPLNYGPGAHQAAIALLREVAKGPARLEEEVAECAAPALAQTDPPRAIGTEQSTEKVVLPEPTDLTRGSDEPSLTPGVALIEGRVTGASVKRQCAEAEAQPEPEVYDGDASSALDETTLGQDLLGTAVRMNRVSKANDATCAQKLKSVSLFVFLTGVQRVGDVRQHHLDRFAKTMSEMPRHYWKSARDNEMTAQEIINVARRAGKPIGLSASTVERHLLTMTAVLDHGRREGNANAFEPRINNLVPDDDRTDDEKRAVFTFEQLRKLFQHPRWQGCRGKGRAHEPGDLILKDHHYWINLILAYSGARRAEIAGLLVEDFGEEDGIPYVYIRPNHLRTLKTATSRRRLPLHPHVMELGFADFVAERGSGSTPIFPEAIPAKMRAQVLDPRRENPAPSDKFGDVLDYAIRDCIERQLGDEGEGLSAHSFRHYVNAAFLEERGEDGSTLLTPDMDRRDILGHKPIDVNVRTYRRQERALGPLHAAISRLPRLF